MLLKNLCEFHKSIPIPRDETSRDYEIPYLHYGDIYKIYNVKLDLGKHYKNIIKVNKKYYNTKYQINNNDIVMNLTSENYSDLGKSVIVKNNNNQKFIAGMETHLIKIFSNNIIPEYLSDYFQSNAFSKTIQQYITGMKVFRVKPADILNIDLLLPSLTEQQHIVDIIGSIDDKIENNTKIIENTSNNIDFIFNKLLLNITEKSQYTIKSLDDISKSIITGTTPSTKNEDFWINSELKFVTIPDMQNQIFITNTERELSNICYESFKTRIIPKNSLIVSCIATVGLVSISTENSLTNQQINSIIFNDENDVYYYYEYMKMLKPKLIQLGSGGSATLNINKNIFSNIDVFVPNEKDLKGYINKVQPQFKLILGLEKENNILNNLKQLYLKKFFD